MHTISGVIAAVDTLRSWIGSSERAGDVAVLEQGFGLLLISDDSLASSDEPDGAFEELSEAAVALSVNGPAALVATEYFGGAGFQMAGLWVSGRRTIEPEWSEGRPINRVLAEMGAIRSSEMDEFDALGLGRYRSNRDWIAFARNGKAAWERAC